MRRREQTWNVPVIATALSLAGCFSPTLPEGFSCADDGVCPDGQFCDPVDDRCRFVGLDDKDGGGVTPTPDALPLVRCDDPDIIVCLEMEGDARDGSTRGADTTAEGLDFADGKLGKAASFNISSRLVVSQYIEASPGPETIEMWLHAEEDGRLLETPLFTSDVDGESLRVTIEGSSLAVGIPTGRFFHLAIGLGERSELYVDGARQINIGFSIGQANVPDLIAGAQSGSFVGRIDQLRVWRRMLDEAEIAAIAAGN